MNGQHVAALEAAWAERVGARYAIALCNGTATLHTALVAAGVQRGQVVATTPLTMSSTSLAILHAGAIPHYSDVDPDTWLMQGTRGPVALPVSLYGLHFPHHVIEGLRVDDAAQTLRPHDPRALFTSYSLQASKIVAAGEGGVLVTNEDEPARLARRFSSLGYQLAADQPRIDPAAIKATDYTRHHALGWNYRMNDVTAQLALKQLKKADALLKVRSDCASMYRTAIQGCAWLKPQQGHPHDYWTYAVAAAEPHLRELLVEGIVRHGGERPYAAWRLSYREPALREYGARTPNADRLQTRLVQFQTNDLESAERNARALMRAIAEVG